MRSFNESQTLTEEKFVSCVRYIEENPVRAGLAVEAKTYPYSSAGRSEMDAIPLRLRG